ncbi:MAG: metallophosphoesterase [Candidatus Aenigmatarchaeota archaeon]
MKIAVFSDTHDNTENVKKLIKKINRLKVDYAFHLGDICSPFTIKLFENLKVKKLYVVFGNNDGDKVNLIKNMPKNAEYFNLYGEVGILGKKIFFTHYDILARAVAFTNRYDIVLFGHTHKKEVNKIGKTLLINPGEILGYFGKPSFCVIDLEETKYLFYSL